MEATKDWIRNLPSTNYRIFLGIWLSVFVVLAFTICVAIQREIQVEAIYAIFAFLGVVLGLDVTQFNIKRKTEIVTPPQTTAENAVSQVPAVDFTRGYTASVLTKQAAQQAAEVLDRSAKGWIPPGLATATIEAEQPQTATIAAAHAFDPGA